MLVLLGFYWGELFVGFGVKMLVFRMEDFDFSLLFWILYFKVVFLVVFVVSFLLFEMVDVVGW